MFIVNLLSHFSPVRSESSPVDERGFYLLATCPRIHGYWRHNRLYFDLERLEPKVARWLYGDTLPWPRRFPGSGEVRAGCNCRTGAWLTAFVFSYRWCRRVYVEKGWDNKGRKWKLNLDTWGENYKLKQEITQPKISTFYDLRRKTPNCIQLKCGIWHKR